MFRSIGPWEIALIVLIILIFFGVGKLPQVGEAIGKAIRSFRKASAEDKKDTSVSAETKPPETPKN
jgi:sec-independent protein translocase protein TatA